MKWTALAVVAALSLPTALSAQVRVKGYVNKNGTYVAPHYRSRPNSSTYDNYSTKGNVNPYTGKVGTRNPYSYGSNNYGSSNYGSSSSSSSGYGSNGYGSSGYGSSGYSSNDTSDDSYGSDPE